MTSEEIVKALRTCVMDPDDGGDCENCPASRSEGEYCLTAVMSQAASLIEQLIDENAALREKVPQWISVEERRPEPGVRVIATDGVFVGEAYGGMLGEWRRYDNYLCWFDVTGQEVTHWMPLPEAPEEGGKA